MANTKPKQEYALAKNYLTEVLGESEETAEKFGTLAKEQAAKNLNKSNIKLTLNVTFGCMKNAYFYLILRLFRCNKCYIYGT